MSEYILEMKGIVKAFAGTLALDHVDFSLVKGEVMALIGENGAGKSTLMNVLMGLFRPDEGTILLDGEPIENKTPYEALQHGIGMVPQELNLVPDLSVAENVFLERHQKNHHFIDWFNTYKKAEEEIAKLDVAIDPHSVVRYLNAGYQQLVSITRTLAMGSNIIILDEPTASLTNAEADILFSVIRKLKADHKTIIIITHHLDEVEQIADRVSIMRDGQMVKVANVKELSIDEMIFYMANQKAEKASRVKRAYSSDDILTVEHLSRKREFQDISFSVKKGELLGVAGLVGSGRTELFSCIYGLTRKDQGQIYFEGKPVSISSPHTAIDIGFGFVPEERRRLGIFPTLQVDENIMLPSYNKVQTAGLIRFPKVRAAASRHIASLRIKTASGQTLIRNLSGGNQQKAILARWLEKDVRLLILDEPTRGIDVRAKAEIYKLIHEMVNRGITVVIISSEIEELLAVSDRIMVMFQGKIKGYMIPDENSTREDVLKIALQ